MSAGIGNSGGDGQDFELNLASIIDCFTVLIAFMLASASFLAVGVLDAGISAASAAPSETKPPSIQVEVTLKSENRIALKVTGKTNLNREFGSESELLENLKSLRAQNSDLASLTLQAEDQVPYKRVVASMEQIRKTVPGILLGGF